MKGGLNMQFINAIRGILKLDPLNDLRNAEQVSQRRGRGTVMVSKPRKKKSCAVQ